MSESDEQAVARAIDGRPVDAMVRLVTALQRDLRERCFDRWVRKRQGVHTHPEEVPLVASPVVEVTEADREAARALIALSDRTAADPGWPGLLLSNGLVLTEFQLARRFAQHRARQ